MEDLCDWIPVLEKIETIILKHGSLIAKFELEKKSDVQEEHNQSAKWMVCTGLRFLSVLFRAARNKSYFLSFEVCYGLVCCRWCSF